MEVEFICRFPKDYTKEELDDIDAQAKALMCCDSELSINEARRKVTSEETEQYSYSPCVLEMNDIHDYNALDDNHTVVIKPNGMVRILKINWEKFKGIKAITTGSFSTPYTQFLDDEPRQKPKRNGKQ